VFEYPARTARRLSTVSQPIRSECSRTRGEGDPKCRSAPPNRCSGTTRDPCRAFTPHVCHHCQMKQRISLVTLGVSDLARARTFYEALGWSGAQQPDDEVCFFQAGGMVFGLWTALGGHGGPGIELAHNVRSPEEVTKVLNERRGLEVPSSAAPLSPIGAVRLGRSPTLMDTCGKWHTIRAGHFKPPARSKSRERSSGLRDPRPAELGHPRRRCVQPYTVMRWSAGSLRTR